MMIFYNNFILLSIFLTFSLSSTGCSFSCHKRIKSDLRFYMGQTGLSSLSVINVQSDIARKLTLSNLIEI